MADTLDADYAAWRRQQGRISRQTPDQQAMTHGGARPAPRPEARAGMPVQFMGERFETPLQIPQSNVQAAENISQLALPQGPGDLALGVAAGPLGRPLGALGRAALGAAGLGVEADEAKAGGGGALEMARRALDELGFFSKALEEAKGAKMNAGTVQQWKNVLQKQGVKPAELDATGFNALPIDQKLNRDDVINYLTENRVKLGEARSADNQGLDKLRDEIRRAEQDYYDAPEIYGHGSPEVEAARNRIQELSARGPALGGFGEPRFEEYTLPGGANYRENLLTLPPRMPSKEQQRATAIKYYNENRGPDSVPFEDKSPAEQRRLIEYFGDADVRQVLHQSSHWDEPNVVAHTRTKERLGPNGERVLHIDEIQSDWAQQGRESGFKDPQAAERAKALEAEYEALSQQMRELTPLRVARQKELEAKVKADLGISEDSRFFTNEDGARYWPARDELVFNDPVLMDLNERFSDANFRRQSISQQSAALMEKGAYGVQPAPFVTQTKDWTDLALKRAMIEAERGGYDAVAWTPGAHHAERYNMSNQVGEMNYHPETGRLEIRDPYGDRLHDGYYKPEQLPGVIGKDNADRVMIQIPNEDGYRSLAPADMTWGGEGMKAYYDKIVPDRLTKLARTLDPEARLESMPAGVSPREFHDMSTEAWDGLTRHEMRQLQDEAHNVPEAVWPNGNVPPPQLPMLRLTPRMKEEIQKGLPLFVGAPVVAGGALSTLNQEQAPMANEFARGGPVREQREQERWQDIERQSPSREMLGDSAYRYYMPAYERLMATRPIGGTDAYRLPPVQRFEVGGLADRGYDADPLGGMSESMFSDMIGGSTNSYGGQSYGSTYGGGGYGTSTSTGGARDSNIATTDGVTGGNTYGGSSSYGSGGYDYGRDGGWSGAASQNSAIGYGADNGGASAYYDYADPYNYGMYTFNPPAPQMSVGPLYDAPAPAPQMSVGPQYDAPAPAPDMPEPGYTGVGADIMTQAGMGPAPGYNVGSMLGGLGLNAFDPTPVAQQNIDLAAAVPDNQSWDPRTSGPTSQFNQPFGSTLTDLAASTNLAQLGSPDDIEDAPDRGFRGMQLSNVAADDPFASFTPDNFVDRGFRGQPLEGPPVDNYVDRGLRGLPSEGPPVDTSMPAGLVGNAASSKYGYTSDLVGPFSPQGVRNVAAVGQTEVDVIARQMARDLAREQGITVAQAMPDARAMALQHFVEVVQNRSASFGPKGFGGQTYNPSIEQVLEQRAAFSAVPNTQSRVDGRYPGRVEELPVSDEYLAATERVLSGIAAGRREFPTATHFMNPDESSRRAMNQWGTDFVRDPNTVKVAGPAGSSHYVGNPDGINVPNYQTLAPVEAIPNNLPSSISANDRARGARRADADIPELDAFATERSIMSELFGINPAMAQPVSPNGTPAPASGGSFLGDIGRSISSGIRSLTGTVGDPTDPANAARPPADYDPFAAVDVRDTTGINRGNALVDGLVRAGPGIAASWPSDAMAGRYSELGNLGNQPLTAAAYRDTPAVDLPAPVEVATPAEQPDEGAPAGGSRTASATPDDYSREGWEAYQRTSARQVDPLTGREYYVNTDTGDLRLNPTYTSRAIDFGMGLTPLGLPNGLLGLVGGVTGYPLSVGQLMALGNPGQPLANAGSGDAPDKNGNYGSYGEGAAGRDPPGVQSAYRDPAAPVAGSPSGGGGALSTVAAALPTPVSLPSLRGRQYLGEDDDPRTYGMRAMRRYYGDA